MVVLGTLPLLSNQCAFLLFLRAAEAAAACLAEAAFLFSSRAVAVILFSSLAVAFAVALRFSAAATELSAVAIEATIVAAAVATPAIAVATAPDASHLLFSLSGRLSP